ncbi:MAG: uracil phosphoribosyltransferase [Clostridiaceae bacterium]|nr:uracil phosphoribosyltransferase [Clostridiaceae bacterium]
MNETKEIGDVFIFDHPLIQHKITMMRDKNTNTKDFRDLVNEVAMLMAYEVTRDLCLKDVEIETPMEKMTGKMIAGKDLALVPILRAGLGMVDGMLNLVPSAKVGHIGLYRDPETLEPVEYYCKLPDDVATRDVILLDPMLATGNSAVAAVDFLKQRDIDSIKFVCLIAAPEGIKHLHAAHPCVPIYCAALDSGLNEHAYILPGLGDAGDRLFGPK